MNILYDAVLAGGATEWYGAIVVSNLRYEDGSAVTLNAYLAMNFASPAAVDPTAITPMFSQWVLGTTTATSTALGDGTFEVDATISVTTPYTLIASDQITFGINGDLTVDTDTWLNSFVFAADSSPAIYGTVVIDCAPSPDPALASVSVSLTFTRGDSPTEIPVSYDSSSSYQFEQGSYTITAEALTTPDQTVTAPAIVTPAQIEVATNATTEVDVTFGPVQRYSALDITVGTLSGLSTQTLAVTVTETSSGTVLAAFNAAPGSTTPLRKLPATGTAQVCVQPISLNNTNYTFNVPPVTLANNLQTVTIDDTNTTRTPIDTTGFVTVTIDMQVADPVSDTLLIRLTGSTMNYVESFSTVTQSTAFSVPVRPDAYTVVADDFIASGVVNVVDAPSSLSVTAPDGATLEVSISASANLNVPGFPGYLSFGGCTDLTSGNRTDFVAARASSIFAYAGVDGGGDATVYLTEDQQTSAAIELARNVEQDLGNTQPVLPVMVSYTCNLSLGDTPDVLANADAHAHSFANYILTLNTASNYADSHHTVPAGFIVNPDFLGSCQQANLAGSYAMPVISPLQTALDHWSIAATIPPEITDTLAGYVLAVNWLTRTVAPWATFGWQINLWGVGYSEWMYEGDVDPADMAQQTANYVASLGAYGGTYPPDFLAIDRYEADDYTQRGYVNGYCYGPLEWTRFFDFCRAVSRALKLPIMPWQIPASRTPVTTDTVDADFDPQHWGTGGSSLLGDPAVGSNYHNVHPTILALEFPEAFQQYMGQTAEDMYIRSEPFDISNPLYGDFPLRGIFAVLLGGGSTTGIVSSIGNPESWTRDKLNAYMQNPIRFDS